MKLLSIENNGFKGHNGKHSLSNVNLISGDNRSGKTAIIAAMQACCGGGVDGVGSANAKLALLCGEQCSASATLEIEGGHKLSFQVLSGKTAKVKHSIELNGMSLEVEAAKQALFGGVPQYPKGLFALSGEDMWNLMLPQGDGKAPDNVVAKFNIMKRTRQDCGLKSDHIRLLLDNKDLGVAATEGLAATKEALSETKKLIEQAELQLATVVPEYTGLPKDELDSRATTINATLKDHQEAKRKKDEVAREIERLQSSIDANKVDTISPQIRQLEDSLAFAEKAVSLAKATVKTPENSTAVRRVIPHLATLASSFESICSIQTFDGHESVAKFIKDLQEWTSLQATRETNSPRSVAANKLYEFVNGQASVTLDTCESNPAYYVEYFERQATTVREQIATKQELLSARKTQQELNIDKLDKLRANVSDIQSPEVIVRLSKELEDIKRQQQELQQIELLNKRHEQVGGEIGKLNAAMAATEELIATIQAWRREVIDVSVATIVAMANSQLGLLDLEPIKIELSTGKRSSVSVLTESGVNMVVLSGAEATMYGAAILYAIQKFRGVRCPIIFVEGGEMMEHYLVEFLTSYVDANVNLVVAHYLSPEVRGCNTIHIREEVAV